MKYKKTLKRIITIMICAAVMLTGFSFDGTITANAAKNYPQLKSGSTVNMKVGERKRFLIKDSNGRDLIPLSKWTTPDRTKVMIDTDFVNQKVDLTEYIEFIALSAGTVTITGRDLRNDAINQFNGTDRSFDSDITITVNVTELDEATAKQLKCNHSWKKTIKSTCQYAGIKTCKKCGLQKKAKKAAHKFADVVDLGHEVLDIEYQVFCDKGCSLDSIVKLSDYATSDEIKKAHYVETNDGKGKVTADITGVSDSIRKAYLKAMDEALERHSHVLGNWYFGGNEVLSKELVAIKTVECIKCGEKKQ